MKKLLLMLGVAASAVGVFADGPTYPAGINFDSSATGPFSIGPESGSIYWYCGDTNSLEATITAYGAGETSSQTTVVSAATQSNYLKLESTSQPLYRTLNYVTGESVPAGVDIGDGLYVDTLVKFTVGASDYTEPDSNNAKLAVWLAGENGDGEPLATTNIMVRAGYIDANGDVVPTNYTMSAISDVEGWHRLTVKAISNIAASGTPYVGFVVFVDGTALTTLNGAPTIDATFAQGLSTAAAERNNAHTLLPSLRDSSNEGYNALACVGFSGTGFVDDIAFTDAAPFAAAEDASAFTITWDGNVASVTVTVGNGSPETFYPQGSSGSQVITLPTENSVYLIATYAEGYAGSIKNGDAEITAGAEVVYNDAKGATFAVTSFAKRYQIGNKFFASLSDALAAATSGSTIKMLLAETLAESAQIDDGATVVLDLNGQTLTGPAELPVIAVSGALTITNSAENTEGVILPGTDGYAIAVGGTLITYGGCKFAGDIDVDGGDTTFYGGKFKSDAETTADWPFIGSVPSGVNVWLGTGDDAGYIVVGGEEPEPPVPEDTWATRLGDAVGGAYEIDNLTELTNFQAGVAAGLETSNETFKLTADITLDAAWEGIGVKAGKDLVNGGNKDIPAYEAGAFRGTFDGQNHTISNFQMENGTDYGAFFNSVNGATIRNLKISFKENKLCANSSSDGGDTGATFVGVARGSTLQNLTALAGTVTTVSASKDMGGIVGYLMAGSTVDSCTNELNIASLKTGRKCGGIAIITQDGSGTAIIRNCKNTGTVATPSSTYNGGLVGYLNANTLIDGCENTANVQLAHVQGTPTVTVSGVNTGYAGVVSIDKAGINGLNFATVSGNVATFVADNALALNGSYKVMAAGATATFAFAEAGTIAFDTALATPTTYAITAAEGLDLSSATDGSVTTYTAAVPTPTPSGLDPAAGTTNVTVTAASAEAAIEAVAITAPAGSSADATAYKALFVITATPSGDGTFDVAITGIKETVVDTVDTSALTALTTDASTITIPAGLYYKITPSADLANWGTADSGLSAGSVDAPSTGGTGKGFYKVELSATPFAQE